MAKVLIGFRFNGGDVQIQGNGAKDALENYRAVLSGLYPDAGTIVKLDPETGQPADEQETK